MSDPNHPRKFDEAFKRQIVKLYDAGKPASEIMAEYDLGNSTLLIISRRGRHRPILFAVSGVSTGMAAVGSVCALYRRRRLARSVVDVY